MLLVKTGVLILLFLPVFWCIWGIARGEQLAAGMHGAAESGHVFQAAGSLSEDGYSIGEESGNVEDFLQMTGISLKPGIYRIEIDYESSSDWTNLIRSSIGGGSYHALMGNDVRVFSGLEHMDYLVWLREKTDSFSVHADYAGTGTFVIKDIRVLKTNQGSICTLVLLLAVYLLAGSYQWWKRRHRDEEKRRNGKYVMAGLTGIVVLSSLPLLVDYYLGGGDMGFHLLRIEGLAEGLKSGQIPVRIQPEWLKGHGYAVSIFYCDTFLLLPALLRLAGFPVFSAYRFFMIAVNLATAWIAYVCFMRLFSSRYIGLLGSVLYTLAPYRLYCVYTRNAVGEYTAMTFLPLICAGFVMVFRNGEAEGTEEERRGRRYLVLGFTGIVQSHVITVELVLAFSVLMCIVLWRYLFRKKVILDMIKAASAVILLNLWYIVPFMDYFITGDFGFKHASARRIQERGLLAAHLFYTWNRAGENEHFNETGMTGTVPATVGAALLICILLFLYWRMHGKKAGTAGWEYGTARVALFIGCTAMLCSLNLFPWDKIQRQNRIFASLVSNIQFPMRFLLVAAVTLSLLGCAAGKLFLNWKGERKGKIIIGCIMAVGVFSSMFYTNDMLFCKDNVLRLYTAENMGNGAILGAEYLPYGTEQALISYQDRRAGEGVRIEEYHADYLEAEIACENKMDGDGYIDCSLLYYKGYRAEESASGEKFRVTAGENGLVRVIVPADFQGKIRVWFEGMWYWRFAEIISLMTLAGMIIAAGISRSSAFRRLRQQGGNKFLT